MLSTPRLDLIPATPALVRADLDGRERLERALGAAVPVEWPPELFDEPALAYTLDRLEAGPEQAGWWLHYVVLREPVPTAVGVVGYKGPPSDGEVEVGYSVLPDFQRRGYASEATAALVDAAFAHPDVVAVTAETLPALPASIGVLVGLGFRFMGQGAEPGVIRYRRERPAGR